ncbi:MAG: CRISPR-associated protein Cas5 [Thermoanaerobacteraceae bacterium]|nr:CRISPR-associated protein Cas5 [Thermoanaerobacteraceae bacterium]
MNEVLVFDLIGPMAHFRKYYTNTSALTYGFPPRTALMGIVAAVLGYERDSYYQELDRGRFAVAVKAPTRRLIQTVNYVRTKKEDLPLLRRLGRVPGTQTPLEFLLPGGEHHLLRFRVFFAHPDAALLREAARRLKDGRPCFPLYLGLTECLATAWYVNLFGVREYQTVPPGTTVALTSVLNAAHLDMVDLPAAETARLVRERAPYAFGPGRALRPPIAVVYEAGGRPLPVRLRSAAYRFPLPPPGGEETVAFLEG